MALLFIEGFEGWGVTPSAVIDDSMQRRWEVSSYPEQMKVQVGRVAGYAVSWIHSSDKTCKSPDLGANTTLYIGFGLKFDTLAAKIIFSFYEPSATLGINIRITAAGELAIHRGVTNLATTSGLNLLTDTWYYIECQVTINNTTGSYELHVAENNVLSDSGVDTQAGATAELRQICLNGSSINPWFDDVYVNDSGFYGNCRVDAIFPNEIGATTNWTPDSGDNYDRVKENPSDDDTSYVEDDTSENRDLYNYGAVPAGLGAIKGIQIATECRETDAETFDLVTVIKSDITVSADAGQTIGTTDYTEKRRISETDPHTTVAWTSDGLNSAQFGIEVG